ncbi:hypothetical protein LshimejAT787_1801330 [Lyophyllum shimeji]|uniref:BTB domain-containing protein n=1 Tax=Lyophyllum shimeji TaxID=47721 RepID=A0A9P3Q032_LYOSH|nr:hypothetical protein LshimejAT787_1801330 [Lyophyllum shimeji]
MSRACDSSRVAATPTFRPPQASGSEYTAAEALCQPRPCFLTLHLLVPRALRYFSFQSLDATGNLHLVLHHQPTIKPKHAGAKMNEVLPIPVFLNRAQRLFYFGTRSRTRGQRRIKGHEATFARLAGSDNQGLGDMTSSIFNAADADLVFRSSDGVLFRIHRKNLEFGSDGFPPVEFPVDDKPVDLPEDGKTLELMFRFVYPRLQPTLEGLDFRVLAHLAEAVEKYQIFTGKQLCNLYMSEALPTNAMAILEYSIKHEYPALANRAAPHVTLKDLSQKKMITDVSDNVLRAWVPYYNRWTEAIRGIMTSSIHSFQKRDARFRGPPKVLTFAARSSLFVTGVPPRAFSEVDTSHASCCGGFPSELEKIREQTLARPSSAEAGPASFSVRPALFLLQAGMAQNRRGTYDSEDDALWPHVGEYLKSRVHHHDS